MNITINTDDLDKLLKRIGAMPVKNTLNKSIRKSILTLEREAKIRTPVKTGLLRNSYEVNFADLEGMLRNFREYAPFVERRRGFIASTLDESEWKIIKIFDDDIETLIKSF